VVEFALVAAIAVSLTLAVVQLALFLYERNLVPWASGVGQHGRWCRGGGCG
jgi:hypothetical protein